MRKIDARTLEEMRRIDVATQGLNFKSRKVQEIKNQMYLNSPSESTSPIIKRRNANSPDPFTS
jgi:hypothetical protein